MPFFSVIIPLYNKERSIKTTLNSVINQSFTDFEIIIINDGSTDNGEAIVAAIPDSRISFYNKKNQGVSHARNYGIEKANGNYISFLDADDFWHSTHLENLYKLSKDFPDAQIYCTSYMIKFSIDSFKKTYLFDIDEQFRGYIDNFFRSSRFDSIIHTGNCAINAYLFDKDMLFDTNMRSGQDTDLWIRLALNYKTAIDNTSKTYTYVKNSGSLSNSNFVKDRILFIEKYKTYEKDNLEFKRYMDQNRYSVALNYKINSKATVSKYVYQKINSQNINFKQKVVFLLPVFILKIMFYIKKFMDKKGLFLHLYR